MASEAVQVCCRLRPRRDVASATCVHSDGSSTLTMRGVASTGLAFSFNHVLGEAATQSDVYDAVGRPVVASVCAGVNGAILAFGQTSSGKTHTIHGTASAPGLVPHAMAEIFDMVERARRAESPYTFEVRMSFVEVYNERIYDLLSRCAQCGGLVDDYHATGKSKFLFSCGHALCYSCSSQVRLGSGHADEERCKRLTCPAGCSGALWRGRRSCSAGLSVSELGGATAAYGQDGLWLGEATEEEVQSLAEVNALLRRGEVARKVAATGMNANSSRSHAILVCSLTQRNQISGKSKASQLYFADLAGSENLGRSGAGRLAETAHINRSLFSLGQVIDALLAGDRHVPYRDSKLTRLLQNALGGNARTSLIVTCSAETDCASETLSTLRFGARAAQVVTQPTVNEFETPAHLRAKLAEAQKTIGEQAKTIAALHRQVALLQRQLTLGLPGLTLGGGFGGGLGYDALERPQSARDIPLVPLVPSAPLPPADAAPLAFADVDAPQIVARRLTDVPSDVLLLVLGRLGAADLCAVAATCGELWHLVSHASLLWEPAFKKKHGAATWEAARQEAEAQDAPTLRELYLRELRRKLIKCAAKKQGELASKGFPARSRLGFRLVGVQTSK